MIKRVFMILFTIILFLSGCSNEENVSNGKEENGEGRETSLLQDGQVFVAEWGETFEDLYLLPGEYSLAENELYYVSYDYEQDGSGVSNSHIFRKRPKQEPEVFYLLEKEYVSFLFADRQGAAYCISKTQEEGVLHLMKYNYDGVQEYDEAISFEGSSGLDQASVDIGRWHLSIKDGKVTLDGTICLADLYGKCAQQGHSI